MNILKFLIVISLIPLWTFGQKDKESVCTNLLSAEQAVANYMDMHIADFQQAPDLWEQSLYKPLRNYVQKVIESTNNTELHFVYIGAGRQTPLFDDPIFVDFFRSRVSRVTLIDISKSEALLAVNKGKGIIPEIIWSGPLIADVTGGAAQKFIEISDEINLLTDNLNLKELFNKLGNFQFKSLLPNFSVAGLPNADIIYSEMVATFTGTPTIMALQNHYQSQLNKMSDLQKSNGQIMLDKQSIEVWQVYNDLAYLSQMRSMGSVLKPNGIIAVAKLRIY